jgi:tetratricopeptide (TPR) repeat protein
MKIKLLTLVLLLSLQYAGFTQTAAELHETAKSFMRQGDYANSILVLNRAILQEPGNMAITKDLALSHYYQKDNVKALEIIKPILDRDDVDDQSFQIAGNIYKQLQEPKELEKLYKKGLKKFPDSGPLYNDLGELMWAQKDYDAIKNWEKGIEADPSYSRNYYNAARYYFLSPDKVWSILYAEIFLNMEPLSKQAPEIKKLLVDSYKKLFTEADLEQNNKDKNNFVKAYLNSMNRQTSLASAGINPESLTMIRTRFILDWFNNKNSKYPFRLFEYQQQLLREGLFDAYNQWLFGSVQSLPAYQNWISTHSTEQSGFAAFQKGRIFKIPKGQYYH